VEEKQVDLVPGDKNFPIDSKAEEKALNQEDTSTELRKKKSVHFVYWARTV
jgi:hypothetical protein